MVMLLALALGLVVAGCGGGVNSASSTPAPTRTGPPPINVAETWPGQFCRATIGMTRQQMRALMGEPTKEYTAQNTPEGADPQMVWEAYGYHFTALFDADDKVSQLDIDDTDLSPEQKADLPCATTRTQ
jgi:hypothetical protein